MNCFRMILETERESEEALKQRVIKIKREHLLWKQKNNKSEGRDFFIFYFFLIVVLTDYHLTLHLPSILNFPPSTAPPAEPSLWCLSSCGCQLEKERWGHKGQKEKGQLRTSLGQHRAKLRAVLGRQVEVPIVSLVNSPLSIA